MAVFLTSNLIEVFVIFPFHRFVIPMGKMHKFYIWVKFSSQKNIIISCNFLILTCDLDLPLCHTSVDNILVNSPSCEPVVWKHNQLQPLFNRILDKILLAIYWPFSNSIINVISLPPMYV